MKTWTIALYWSDDRNELPYAYRQVRAITREGAAVQATGIPGDWKVAVIL